MLTVLILLAHTAAEAPAAVWRNYDEVFDLAVVDGRLVAATNGGLLRQDGTTWTPIASSSGVRSIQSTNPISVMLADGRTVQLQGREWSDATVQPRRRTLAEGVLLDPLQKWPADGDPPPANPYSVLVSGHTVYAGTNQGLYERIEKSPWRKLSLPGELPIARPNGIAKVDGTFVVGGLGGLFVGTPGHWQQSATDSIRQVVANGPDVWVVHGNGSVDKIHPQKAELWPDLLFGGSRRPWTACVCPFGNSVLFGGSAGWQERGPRPREHYPDQMKGDVVQCIAGDAKGCWIGTEKSGLFRFDEVKLHCWNPGNGLTDPNVTALLPIENGVIVGTAHAGLFEVTGGQLRTLNSPTQRVTALGRWKNQLVVGGMDGCWVQTSSHWTKLATSDEETTSIAVFNGRLAVTTASGIYFWS